MGSPISPRAEFAAAIRGVNAAYSRLPADKQPEVAWNPVDDAVEAALKSGDDSTAFAAIEEWRAYHLRLIEEAAK
jgi:hypothetical protein